MAGYRRGLVGPYYGQGRRGLLSRIRENLVLDMVELEEIGEARARSVSTYASVAGPHYDPGRLKFVLEHYGDELRAINALCAYNPDGAKSQEEKLVDSTQKLVQLYRELVASGEDKRILQKMKGGKK